MLCGDSKIDLESWLSKANVVKKCNLDGGQKYTQHCFNQNYFELLSLTLLISKNGDSAIKINNNEKFNPMEKSKTDLDP